MQDEILDGFFEACVRCTTRAAYDEMVDVVDQILTLGSVGITIGTFDSP